MLETGFTYEGHLNFLIHLGGDPDALWRKIQSRKRRYIRRNQGFIRIRRVRSRLELNLLYSVLKKTYSRIKLPLLDVTVFEDLLEGEQGLFLIAEHNTEIVAARVALLFEKSIYDWYAGSWGRAHRLHANESIIWWLLKFGTEHGMQWFDFGGAGNPSEPYGPRDFKSQFGGELVNFGRYRFILSSFKNMLFTGLLRSRKIIQKRAKRIAGECSY
jgi:lipid II:glycine glycyltransferase (peptidoglycan interpeptide bridge formation enzyme)